jgi:hypothetical protein
LGDLREFIAAERAKPVSKLIEGVNYFQDRPFTEWGPSPQRFWGFTMMLLATLHGQEDWALMKEGKMGEILDSFAWAEGNAVELYDSSAAGWGVPREYWEAVRRAGDRFNRFRHIVETLRPHAALVLYRGLNPTIYFEGYRPEVIFKEGRLTHYRLPEVGVDVFHAPHPGSMNRIEGTDHFRTQLGSLFARNKIITPFPEFLSGQDDAHEVMNYLGSRAPAPGPDFDKYSFVSWVAEELAKRGTSMSVPTLIDLVNAQGYETNYGTEFSGGRGSYNLVSGTYHRMKTGGTPDAEAKAHNVAVAFRKPNFEYAYNTD